MATYTELIRQLALERQRHAALRQEIARAREELEQQLADVLADVLAEEQDTAERIASLEATLRTEAAQYAQANGKAPCPGLKVHNERVVRYVDDRGVILDTAAVRSKVCEHVVDHGWLSMLKPDITAWEKAIRALPDEERPDWARVEWQTTVSIDRDLEPILKGEL